MKQNPTSTPLDSPLACEGPAPAGGFNLLRFRPIAALVRWPAFPAALQLLTLAVFVYLAIVGWGHHTPQGVNAKLYAKTNLVNLLIWGLWWPAMVWVTFFLGRAWCAICPLELVSTQAERLGGRLGLTQRPLSRWLVRGSLIIVFFAILQMLVPGIQIHRVPHYTALFLCLSLGLALVVGLFLKDRAFCRGFCPISLLLNAYGRGGMLAVRPPHDRDGNGNELPDARSCPSLLNPARLDSNKDCLVCGDCIQAHSSGAMELVLRPPYSKADTREPFATWPLTLFVMVVSGFVIYELTGVWNAAAPVFLWVPKQVGVALNATAAATGWIQGLWTIVAVPLALWLVLALATILSGGARSLGEAWRRIALPLAVVVATGHMAKALEKFTSWAGFLPFAWAEPTGVETALKMSAKTMAQPAAWLGPQALSLGAMVLIAGGSALALREARLADPEYGHRRFAPIVLLGGFYFFLVFGWGNWIR